MYCNALRDRLQVKNAVKSVKIKNILECSEKLQRVFIFFRNSEIVQNNYGIRNNSVLKYCQKVIWERKECEGILEQGRYGSR